MATEWEVVCLWHVGLWVCFWPGRGILEWGSSGGGSQKPVSCLSSFQELSQFTYFLQFFLPAFLLSLSFTWSTEVSPQRQQMGSSICSTQSQAPTLCFHLLLQPERSDWHVASTATVTSANTPPTLQFPSRFRPLSFVDADGWNRWLPWCAVHRCFLFICLFMI